MKLYKNLKGFWGRRGYQRLNVGNTRRSRNKAELGSCGKRRRRRFWRIKKVPKLRFISPKKLLIKLRDTYVNFMLRIASSAAFAGGGSGFGAVDYGVGDFGMRPMKEYDEKVIVEIYKLVKAQGQIVPHDNPDIKSGIVCASQSGILCASHSK